LSKENNEPRLVEELFGKHAKETAIVIASRYEATAVYSINTTQVMDAHDRKPVFKPVQLGLFQ